MISSFNSHVLSLSIDLFHQLIFLTLDIKGIVDSFNILRKDSIELHIEGHFLEVLADFFLTKSLLLSNIDGIELIDFKSIAGSWDDADNMILREFERFIDQRNLLDWVDERGSGGDVDSFKDSVEHWVAWIEEALEVSEFFVSQGGKVVVHGDIVLVGGEVETS